MITAKDELAHNVDLLGAEEVLRRIEAHEGLIEACQAALSHVVELRDAWERGALSEHDGGGGTRSNRNVEVENGLRAALAAAETKGTTT